MSDDDKPRIHVLKTPVRKKSVAYAGKVLEEALADHAAKQFKELCIVGICDDDELYIGYTHDHDKDMFYLFDFVKFEIMSGSFGPATPLEPDDDAAG